jgi:uncharacterized membrane protein YeaQ/YmgE (transglycosylase-associated protein family)
LNPFRRSGFFGIVGVFVVAALCVYVAQKYGQDNAHPKKALGLVFGIVGAYIVLLILFQNLDLMRAERATVPDEVPQVINNPAVLDEPVLWAALAIEPIDDEAVRARRQVWGITRGSMHGAWLVTGLIMLTVPPMYLLESFVPLLIGGPIILLIVFWKSIRLMGGGVDEAYNAASAAMAPLGLAVVDHPDLSIEVKGVAPMRTGPVMRGALVLEGERHRRHVTVRMPATAGVRSPSEVRLAVGGGPPFEFKARDGRLKAVEGAPDSVSESLRAVPNSPRWNGVRGEGGDGGVIIRRKSAGNSDWMLDLWLAERLAEALDRQSVS